MVSRPLRPSTMWTSKFIIIFACIFDIHIYSNLYVGTTRRGSTTLSWLAASNVETVAMDIAPLFRAMQPFMAQGLTLGLVQFGSECFFSTDNVTFGVSNFSLSFTTQTTSGSPSTTTIVPSSTKKGDSNLIRPSTGFVGFLVVVGTVMMYVM
jgi:hypothetical protein